MATGKRLGALGAGIEVYEHEDGKHLVLVIPKDGGEPSKTGKMLLCANSAGWQEVPGIPGLKMNLAAGRRI